MTGKSQATLLCLDTSTPACSAALQHQGKIYSRFTVASRSHTQLLLPMIDEVLTEAAIELSAVDALGFTIGPGSFTGIRVGFGVAQGLAFGAQLPVLPVSTLECMAVAAQRQYAYPEGSRVMPMLDARMDEIYWAVFQVAENGRLHRVCDDSLSAPEAIEVLSEAEKGKNKDKLYAVGDGWNYRERLPLSPQSAELEFYPDARAALQIAAQKLSAGEQKKIDEVQPLYLRDKITWQKRQRLRK